MKRNPWLGIPLEDYEGHMTSPDVCQAEMLSDILAGALEMYAPESIAVIGCAGGNGFDRIAPQVTRRVVGIDINPRYVAAALARFRGRFEDLEFLVGDVQGETIRFDPVEMIYAALVFEYVDPDRTLARLAPLLKLGGVLVTVIQLPSDSVPAITPSPFASVKTLASSMKLVSPPGLREAARGRGLRETFEQEVRSPAGKGFKVQVFRRPTETDN